MKDTKRVDLKCVHGKGVKRKVLLKKENLQTIICAVKEIHHTNTCVFEENYFSLNWMIGESFV